MTLTFEQTREANSLRDTFTFTAARGAIQCHNETNGTSYTIRDGRCSCPDYVHRCEPKGERCKHLVALDRTREQAYDVVGDGHLPADDIDQPDPSWVRGACPHCGGPVVSNSWYIGGRGYIVTLDCWNRLGSHKEPTCNYRRVL